MYPKARLDALSDGIFAVAMTLLVLDIRLPEDFQTHDAAALANAVVGLWPKLVPYAMSFGVLGLRWLSNIHLHSHREAFNRDYVNWWLLYHLLITMVPFTAIVVGRFPDLAPSTWLYAGNTILLALVAWRMLAQTPPVERADHLRERQISMWLLVGSAVLAIGVSFISPRHALWAFAVNLAAPLLTRRKS